MHKKASAVFFGWSPSSPQHQKVHNIIVFCGFWGNWLCIFVTASNAMIIQQSPLRIVYVLIGVESAFTFLECRILYIITTIWCIEHRKKHNKNCSRISRDKPSSRANNILLCICKQRNFGTHEIDEFWFNSLARYCVVRVCASFPRVLGPLSSS